MRSAKQICVKNDEDDSELDSSDVESDLSDSSDQTSVENDFVSCIQKIQRQIKLLEKMTRQGYSAVKPKFMIQRDKLCCLCENLMQNSDYRIESVNLMWIHCWYGQIKSCISKSLTNDQKVWLKTFIGCGVGQLITIIERYPELSSTIFIYIGDLYRYSYANCNKNNLDFRFAKYYYLKSADLYNYNNGRPFNQLALLWQEAGEIWLCLNYFLKSLIFDELYSRAIDNIKRLNEFDFDTKNGQRIVFNLIQSFIENFNRSNFEKRINEYEKFLEDSLKENKIKESLEGVYYISNLAIYLLKVNSEQMRTIGALACRIWSDLLTAINNFEQKSNLNNQDGNNLEFSDLFWIILCGTAEFLSFISYNFTTKKIPVALKFQYQNITNLFVEQLNYGFTQILPFYISTMKREDDENFNIKQQQNLIKNWIINGPNCKNLNLNVLGILINNCITNSTTPISFDGKAFYTANGSDKDLQIIEKISKKHLEYVQKEETEKIEKSLIPIYLFPEHEIFLSKLTTLQNIVNTNRFTIVITESVLFHLDKWKKENAQARESIRWLQNSIVKKQNSIITMPTGVCDKLLTVEEAAIKFLLKKNLLERQSLFGTILLCEKIENSDSENKFENGYKQLNYKSLNMENIESFFNRIIQTDNNKMVE